MDNLQGKQYRFFAHFNRINMQRGDPKVWTVHFRGQCIQGEGIEFNVPVRTRYRPEGKQPRAVLIGSASRVFVDCTEDIVVS